MSRYGVVSNHCDIPIVQPTLQHYYLYSLNFTSFQTIQKSHHNVKFHYDSNFPRNLNFTIVQTTLESNTRYNINRGDRMLSRQ